MPMTLTVHVLEGPPPGSCSNGTQRRFALAQSSCFKWLCWSDGTDASCVVGTHLPPGAPLSKQQLSKPLAGPGASQETVRHAPVSGSALVDWGGLLSGW